MERLKQFLSQAIHIAPLASFRLVFGLVMFAGVLRFALKGWIYDLYIAPSYYFTYFGFDFVQPLGEFGMYAIFALMGISFLLVGLGKFYRIASIIAFLTFTYVELIDKSNYLNHYYFVSIISFLLIFVPADRYFSLRTFFKPSDRITHVPAYTIGIFKAQLGLVYFMAGIAKLNPDWMLKALPLKIWLPAKVNIPIFGSLLQQTWVAYVFSWFGAFYDILIPFFLLIKKYRVLAYFFVIVFHLATYFLFQIGMFPFVMIGATIIFFSADWHIKWQNKLSRYFVKTRSQVYNNYQIKKINSLVLIAISSFFLIQLLLPFRYLAYPGKLFWTEQGYRFSWRVMLMEKAGYAIFKVKNPENGREWEVNNYDFLTTNQEKMMSTQADMILQFAHYLEEYYRNMGINNPIITVESYVSLNGTPSQLMIDPNSDLTQIKESFAHKNWILPFKTNAQ